MLGTLKKLRLDRTIAGAASPERQRVIALIAARILDPGSKLATARGLAQATARNSLAETLDIEDTDEDDLYAAMDWLLERQDAIERRLAKRHLADGALVLYDLTSSYLEGRRCPLAKRGHSRDGKRGKLQIEFGLLCDREGCPVAVEVFDGNTADPMTVGTQIDKLRRRFGLHRVVLVGDRGMLTEARIREDVKPAGLNWISALRSSAIRELVESGAVQMSLFDETDLVEVRCDAYPGERLMVCRNPLLAAERARKRKDLLQATERLLEPIAAATTREKRRLAGKDKIGLRVGKSIGKYKMAKHFELDIADHSFGYQRNPRVHRPGSGPGRPLHRAHQPDGGRTRCRGDRARLQAPERRRARLQKPQDRGPQGAAHLPPRGRPGPGACVLVHARLLRRMAHAPTAQAAAVRRRRCGRRRGRASFRRGAGGGFRVRQGEGPEQADRGRPAGAQLPHAARRLGDRRQEPRRPQYPRFRTVLHDHPANQITAPSARPARSASIGCTQ